MRFLLFFAIWGLCCPLVQAAQKVQCLIFYKGQGALSVAVPGPMASKSIDSGRANIEFRDPYYAYSVLVSDAQDFLVHMKGMDLKSARKTDWIGHIPSEMLQSHSAQLMLPVEGEASIEVEGKKHIVKLESAVLSCRRY